MSLLNCDCRSNCVAVSVVFSIIVGIVTAFLTFAGSVAVTTTFAAAAIIVAVAYLAVLFIAAALMRDSYSTECTCTALNVLLFNIIATFIVALVLLNFAFAATSIIGAIVTGLLLLFLTGTITASACLIRCITRCNN